MADRKWLKFQLSCFKHFQWIVHAVPGSVRLFFLYSIYCRTRKNKSKILLNSCTFADKLNCRDVRRKREREREREREHEKSESLKEACICKVRFQEFELSEGLPMHTQSTVDLVY